MRPDLLIIPLSILLIPSCQVEAIKAKVDQPAGRQPVRRQEQNSPVKAEEFCDRLHELKKMPFIPDGDGDEIYNGLFRSKEAAVPCLIDKLTDLRQIKDPRAAPNFSDFRVGDAAFFMLIRITKAPFEEILPPEVMSQWKEQGVYAYFRYVEDEDNRWLLQARWDNWLREREVAGKP